MIKKTIQITLKIDEWVFLENKLLTEKLTLKKYTKKLLLNDYNNIFINIIEPIYNKYFTFLYNQKFSKITLNKINNLIFKVILHNNKNNNKQKFFNKFSKKLQNHLKTKNIKDILKFLNDFELNKFGYENKK